MQEKEESEREKEERLVRREEREKSERSVGGKEAEKSTDVDGRDG